MQTNTKWLIICLGLALIGIVLFIYQEQTLYPAYQDNSEPLAIQRGFLVKGGQDRDKDTWYLEYEKPGSLNASFETIFTKDSVCTSGSLITKCEVDSFTSGQGVQIEGLIRGDKLYVSGLLVLDEQKE
jgi:hypothetical protein